MYQKNKSIAIWLFVCAAMVFVMVVLGGLTRLTHSGLSIVDWRPITGTLPPLTQGAWEQVFALYRETPEYLKVNQGMDLAGFKSIFWLEYIHRLWGRLIGLVFLLPLIYVTVRRLIPGKISLKLLAIFALGFLQGVMGWYMVKSGLVDTPWVSPYRLMVHLMLAFILFALLVGQGMRFWWGVDFQGKSPLFLKIMLALIFITVVYGALVAGYRAGLVYNTFPLMNGHWVPEDAWALHPWGRNLVENPSTIQWVHRILATVTFGYVHYVAFKTQSWVGPLVVLVWLQFILGILTILTQVDILWAILHQANALLVWGAAIILNHRGRLKTVAIM